MEVVAHDLIATLELQFEKINEKLEQTRLEKRGQLESDEHILDRLESLVETSTKRINLELENQRDVLLAKVNNDLKISFESREIKSKFEPGLECPPILNDASHLLGSLVYTNPFSLTKKLAYFELVDQFTREIRLPEPAPSPPIVTPVRILVLAKLNQILVHFNQIDANEGRYICTPFFKMFNFKWDELSMLQVERELGTYKNLIALDRKRETNENSGSSGGRLRTKNGVMVCLFANSEYGRHSLRMYDDRLILVASNEFEFNVKLTTWVCETDEVVCWRADTNQILLFNSR